MAAFPRSTFLIRHLPTVGGVAAGALAAFATILLSTDTLEHLVWTSGIAALVPAAQAPLGTTARLILALGAGSVTGAVVWATLFLLFGSGGFLATKAETDTPPFEAYAAVRRADAHPDAPPRRPMTAADLGTPLMEVETAPAPVAIERSLPSQLDQPLAAFDPAAVPPVPREPQRALPALAPGERLDIFPLSPPPPSVFTSRPVKRDSTAQTIDALLRRLEDGAGRRAARL